MHAPGFNKHESVFICKLFCLFIGDIPLTVQIRLVADQKNHLKYFTSLIYNTKQNNVFLTASLFVLGFRSKPIMLKFLRKYSYWYWGDFQLFSCVDGNPPFQKNRKKCPQPPSKNDWGETASRLRTIQRIEKRVLENGQVPSFNLNRYLSIQKLPRNLNIQSLFLSVA